MKSGDHAVLMTSQAAPRVHKGSGGKQAPDKKGSRGKAALDAIAEYSLSGFLENEPDIYSVSDIKVRYR